MAERFSLKWNDFHTNVSKSFGRLRDEDYLHDVTLVGDDHTQIPAHKLVLSACSEFFQEVFKRSNKVQSHTLLCLEGLSKQDLDNILKYMYNGEVNIYQEDLDRFLSVAQNCLKVNKKKRTQIIRGCLIRNQRQVIFIQKQKMN